MLAASSSTQPGDVIAGKYRVLRPLGHGAMGTVWAVLNLTTEREFALKLVREERPELRDRLLVEARASGRINHRNVVEVYDVGLTEDGSPFLVMQPLHGESLDELLERGPLEASVVARIALETARGLEAAHAKHVVHRDLKPGNIFLHKELDGTTVVKVLDFGVSKVMVSDAPTASVTGLAIGSPAYMSPEQACGRKVDPRTDLWALGVVMFEMLTGKRPFDGDTPFETVAKILEASMSGVLGKLVPHDPALVALATWCLQRDREKRPSSAKLVVSTLAEWKPESSSAPLAIEGDAGCSEEASASEASASDVIEATEEAEQPEPSEKAEAAEAAEDEAVVSARSSGESEDVFPDAETAALGSPDLAREDADEAPEHVDHGNETTTIFRPDTDRAVAVAAGVNTERFSPEDSEDQHLGTAPTTEDLAAVAPLGKRTLIEARGEAPPTPTPTPTSTPTPTDALAPGAEQVRTVVGAPKSSKATVASGETVIQEVNPATGLPTSFESSGGTFLPTTRTDTVWTRLREKPLIPAGVIGGAAALAVILAVIGGGSEGEAEAPIGVEAPALAETGLPAADSRIAAEGAPDADADLEKAAAEKAAELEALRLMDLQDEAERKAAEKKAAEKKAAEKKAAEKKAAEKKAAAKKAAAKKAAAKKATSTKTSARRKAARRRSKARRKRDEAARKQRDTSFGVEMPPGLRDSPD